MEYISLIIMIIMSSATSYFLINNFIAQKYFQEKIRKELIHKQEQEGTITSGGIIFINCCLFFSALYFKNYIGALGIIIISYILITEKHKIFNNTLYQILFAIFILINIILSFFSINPTQNILFIVILSLLIIGFIDDQNKNIYGKGLSEKTIFITTGLVGLIPILYNYSIGLSYLQLGSYQLNLGIFYIPIALFIFSSSVNSCNLTDGFNGGLASIAISISIFFFSHIMKNIFFTSSYYVNIFDNTFLVVILNFIAAIIPFLIKNFKGIIFMGNCGSMAIGGYVGAMAILMKTELLLPIYGIILLIETSSVLLQMFWIKKFKKRIFLFSPIHHHFELLGWKNFKILKLFSLISVFGGIIAFIII